MSTAEIIKAYAAMRKSSDLQSVPDDVLDYVKHAALQHERLLAALEKCAALGGYDSEGVFYWEINADAEAAIFGASDAITAATTTP